MRRGLVLFVCPAMAQSRREHASTQHICMSCPGRQQLLRLCMFSEDARASNSTEGCLDNRFHILHSIGDRQGQQDTHGQDHWQRYYRLTTLGRAARR
jgi:hypothetical protein